VRQYTIPDPGSLGQPRRQPGEPRRGVRQVDDLEAQGRPRERTPVDRELGVPGPDRKLLGDVGDTRSFAVAVVHRTATSSARPGQHVADAPVVRPKSWPQSETQSASSTTSRPTRSTKSGSIVSRNSGC
jgi:hypothetical protein